MNQKEIAQALYEQQFSADRSKRYHAHRLAFHRLASTTIQFIEFAVTSALLMQLLDGWPTARTTILAAAAILSGIAAYQGVSKRIESHAEKKARFGDLKKLFPADLEKGSEELLTAVVEAREDIEKDDSRGFPCLDVLTHNEECLARGLMAAIKPLSLFQRTIGCALLPLPYRG